MIFQSVMNKSKIKYDIYQIIHEILNKNHIGAKMSKA